MLVVPSATPKPPWADRQRIAATRQSSFLTSTTGVSPGLFGSTPITRAPILSSSSSAGSVGRRGAPPARQPHTYGLIAGTTPATSTLKQLARADLVVGHGILTIDYRAMAMVAPVLWTPRSGRGAGRSHCSK